MIKLLQEILDAGKDADRPLDMGEFICWSSCCLCGDVAIKRGEPSTGQATAFAYELDNASVKVFGTECVSHSVWRAGRYERWIYAEASGIFTEEELKHPHLTTDHNDRSIAHDFVRLVMRKVEERNNGTN